MNFDAFFDQGLGVFAAWPRHRCRAFRFPHNGSCAPHRQTCRQHIRRSLQHSCAPRASSAASSACGGPNRPATIFARRIAFRLDFAGMPGAIICLLHIFRTTKGAGHQVPLDLFFKRRTIPEPAIKLMALVTDEVISNHNALDNYSAAVGFKLKARAFLRAGIRPRSRFTNSFIHLKQQNPGFRIPARRYLSPRMLPTRLWPKVCLPLSCAPPCAAANTKLPVSMARERNRTCQWACPVGTVKAAGTAMNIAPALANVL